jgi:hypothetical protein
MSDPFRPNVQLDFLQHEILQLETFELQAQTQWIPRTVPTV